MKSCRAKACPKAKTTHRLPRARTTLCKQPTPLKRTDKILVCRNRSIETRHLQSVLSLCGSAFLQTSGSQIGFNVKDRFSIFTQVQQILQGSALLAFATDSQSKILNCGNNWSAATNTYTIPETGLYSITVSVTYPVPIFAITDSITLTIESNSQVIAIGDLIFSTQNIAQATFQFTKGDAITATLQTTAAGQLSITSQAIHIIQL